MLFDKDLQFKIKIFLKFLIWMLSPVVKIYIKTQIQEEVEDKDKQLQIIKELHGPINGHLCVHKTIELLRKRYKSKGMNMDVEKYISKYT